MRQILTSMLLAGGLLLSGIAAAATSDTAAPDKHVLPVLVAINQAGEVTKVDPAEDLPASAQGGLEDLVRSMITGPVRDKNGKANASQIIMYFSLEPVDGGGKHSFKYQRAEPTVNAKMHWVEVGHGLSKRYSLALDNMMSQPGPAPYVPPQMASAPPPPPPPQPPTSGN